MTWEEFRDEVERQMKEKEIPPDAEIDWIDVSGGWYRLEHVNVGYDERTGVSVS